MGMGRQVGTRKMLLHHSGKMIAIPFGNVSLISSFPFLLLSVYLSPSCFIHCLIFSGYFSLKNDLFKMKKFYLYMTMKSGACRV